MVEHSEQFHARFTADEMQMLRELAEADGISLTDEMRMIVRRIYGERFGAPKPKKKK
jgi:hypothetical protein